MYGAHGGLAARLEALPDIGGLSSAVRTGPAAAGLPAVGRSSTQSPPNGITVA